MQFNEDRYKSMKHAIASAAFTTKVSDFGLAMRLKHNRTHASNVKQGTPFYVAPEVANQRRLHQSSDVYAFGVMMWELMMGCPVYIKRCATPPPPPSLGALITSTCRTLQQGSAVGPVDYLHRPNTACPPLCAMAWAPTP